MKVNLKLKEDNFKNKEFLPRHFRAEVASLGRGTATIGIGLFEIEVCSVYGGPNDYHRETRPAPEMPTFILDAKTFYFTDTELLIEGIISDEKELIGRCVFSVNDFYTSPHTTAS